MFFWNSLAFSMIQQMLAIWSLVPLPFLKSAWASGSSRFTYCWSLAWRILSITSLACEISMCEVVWVFFGIPKERQCQNRTKAPLLFCLPCLYIYLLQTFLDSNHGRKPETVLEVFSLVDKGAVRLDVPKHSFSHLGHYWNRFSSTLLKNIYIKSFERL